MANEKLSRALAGLQSKAAALAEESRNKEAIRELENAVSSEKRALVGLRTEYLQHLVDLQALPESLIPAATRAEAEKLAAGIGAGIASCDSITGWLAQDAASGAAEVLEKATEIRGTSSRLLSRIEKLISNVEAIKI